MLKQGDLQICREARAAGLDPVKMLKAEIDLIKCGDYREKCEGEE